MSGNKPIRVLIIGMHDKIGGVETFLMNYYRNIDRNKIQFDFVSIYDKLCFEDEIKQLGGKIYRICSEKKNPIKYCNQLTKIIKKNNYRIIHINMLSLANILPIIVSKFQKVKHIIIHSHNSNTPSGIVRKILNCINKPFTYLATDFFACSELAAQWMFGKRILKKHNLKIINNAIELDKYKFNENLRNIIRKKLNIENKFVIGHVGRFSFQKNHEFLIDVFYEVQKEEKNAILLLIGEGELEEDIQRKVKELGIESKVMFLGTTNRVQDYLQAMDLFVLPSRFEGLPVVGIEAQASGTKCIFSKNITSEVKVTDNVEFIGLNENIERWKEEILKYKEAYKKDIDSNEIFEKYEIKKASKELTDIYMKMQKINVMHVVYGLGNGGVETLLYNYFSTTNQYNLSIATQECNVQEVKRKFEDIGFKIYKVNEKKHIIKYIRTMVKIIKKEKPDIVHSHMTMGNFLPNAIAFFCGVKVRISHAHFAYAKKNNIYSTLGKLFSNVYMACTKDAASYLFGKTSGKAYILKNAINLEKFIYEDLKRNEIRNKLNINDKYVIGNVGRFTKQKNHAFLLEIFSKIHEKNKNTILLLVGDGELEKEVRNKISELKLDDDVLILSNRSDVNELMMGMDLFLFPTLFEGLGIVLIEAQATGLKCISSENVPNDVKITDRINLINLSEKEKWIDTVKENENNVYDRKIDFQNFKKNGYDINEERQKLYDFYDKALGRINSEK